MASLSVRLAKVDLESLRKKRVETIRAAMEESDLDAIIVTSFDNVRYLTDIRPLYFPPMFLDSNAAVMVRNGEVLPIAAFIEGRTGGYSETALMPPIYVPAPCVPSRWVGIFREVLGKLGFSRGKIGVDYFPFAVYEEAKKEMPNARFEPFLDEFLLAKAIKHNEEIDLLDEVASIADMAAEAGLAAMQENVRERAVSAKMISVATEIGIESVAWYPDLRSGERSLHTIFDSDRRIRNGDAVVFDIGFVGRGGYLADMSRTGFVGRPRDDLLEAYRALYTAYMETIKAIKPGMMASEIHVRIERKLKEMGHTYMTAPTGHGLGIGVDYPWIWGKEQLREKDMKLKPGMVLSIEPVTYAKTGSVKLEDAVLVTETGSKILNKASYLEQWIS
jgi:Xaa-Pro aminopeptidase